MILVDATYINETGGKILLEYFIQIVSKRKILDNFYFLFDKRLNSTYISKLKSNNYSIIKGSELNRLNFYFKNNNKFDRFFCFGNIPPPIKSKNTFILFHNVLLLNKFSFKSIKFFLKKSYIKFLINEKFNWIVQTSLTKSKIIKEFNLKQNQVHIIPFYDDQLIEKRKKTKNSFIYVSNGQSHKNHEFLFNLWKYLNEQKINFTLTTTIDAGKFPSLIKDIESLNSLGCKINNLGIIPFSKINKLLSNHEFLIFPSKEESFGLPLIEGVLNGCKIIAPNLPYVNEVIISNGIYDDLDSAKNLLHDIYLGNKNIDSQIVTKNNIDQIIKLFYK